MPFPARAWDPEVGLEQYRDHLRYLQRADELGYDGICITEHHYAPYGLPSPNVMSGALAATTERVKIVLMGNCLPLHGHPVRLAEELAMLDVLSNGRIVSGVMRGGFTEWYLYNLDAANARVIFEETYNLLIDCWTKDEPFDWEGKFFQYYNVSVIPRTIQRPHPPTIMAASTAESIEWCARKRLPMACSFSPTESMRENYDYYREFAEKECQWNPDSSNFIFSRQVYVSETDAKAREEAGEHLHEFWREHPVGRKLPDAIERYRAAQRTKRSFDYKKSGLAGGQFLFESLAAGKIPSMDWLIDQGLAIIGSPDTVIRQIRQQQRAFGADTMLMYSPFGTLPMDLATKSLELFANEVLPALKEGDRSLRQKVA